MHLSVLPQRLVQKFLVPQNCRESSTPPKFGGRFHNLLTHSEPMKPIIPFKSWLLKNRAKTSSVTRKDKCDRKRLAFGNRTAADRPVSTETGKRRAREGGFPTLRFNSGLIRYRLADIERIEEQASFIHDDPRRRVGDSGEGDLE
jgi:hypothetical protein